MYKTNDTITYRSQDGLVKAKLLKPVFKVLGYQVWNIKVLEVTKKASFGGNPKIGMTLQVSERWFGSEVKA
jgi:hypothetical protein